VAGVPTVALVEVSAADAARAVPKHNATAIAAAHAIEARPRSESSYIIGLSFLVISGAAAPFADVQGARSEAAPSRIPCQPLELAP
jgi:hypothetical protein